MSLVRPCGLGGETKAALGGVDDHGLLFCPFSFVEPVGLSEGLVLEAQLSKAMPIVRKRYMKIAINPISPDAAPTATPIAKNVPVKTPENDLLFSLGSCGALIVVFRLRCLSSG